MTVLPSGTATPKIGFPCGNGFCQYRPAATRLIYAPPPGFKLPPIPANPTTADLASALALIEEAICDFPFMDQASKANTLALLVTPAIRQAIQGKVPLALIDAPQIGTGKGLLAELIIVIDTGQSAAMMGELAEESEWRKQITATLMEGATIILIDNVTAPIKSAHLARALTASLWKDRILGVSKTATVRQRATWIATGNNLRLGGDMPRRCYWIRLDAQVARPWTRTDFRHMPLIPWAQEHRGGLLAAVLTLARAWYAAGRPAADVSLLGSFEEWCATVGGILKFAGIDGFLGNLDLMHTEADEESQQWELFLTAWHQFYGDAPVTVAELAFGIKNGCVNLGAALPDELFLALGSDEARFHRKLGQALSERVGRRYGDAGLHLERAGISHHATLWRVVLETVGGESGSLGSSGCSPDAASEPASSEAEATPLTPQTPPSASGEVGSSGSSAAPPPCHACGSRRFWRR